jgi:hypothetical protein
MTKRKRKKELDLFCREEGMLHDESNYEDIA